MLNPRISPFVILAALALSSSAFATQTDNRGMHAVPTPGKVAIDGSLADWDRSGQILLCYDIETLKDVYSAQVAMMYDAENLYIAIDWTDATPMGNTHHPRFQANRGWAGDAIQLRFKTDRITHLTAWYHAASDQPYVGLDYGKSLTAPFGGGGKNLFKKEGWTLESGAEMAFKKNADGKGYVQEMKIPWSLLTLDKTPKANDSFRCGIELLWGETDWPSHRYADNLDPAANNREFFWTAHNAWGLVTLEPKGNLKLPEPAYLKELRGEEVAGPVPIEYTLPKDARVTLAIDDEKGNRIRNLLAAKSQKAGPNIARWDGLDDNGKPVPAGNYKLRALYHDGIKVNYLISFANPGNPTWDSPDGRGAFYGDHTPPHAVAAAGDFVALACPLGESGRHLIGTDLNGQRLWGLSNRLGFVIGTSGGRASLATDGKTLWVSQDGTYTIYRVDVATGKYSPWNKTANDPSGTPVPILDLKISDYVKPADAPKYGVNLSAIAYHNNTVATALKQEGRILLLDSATGDTRKEIKIAEPNGLTFTPTGDLIVLSAGKLLRVDAEGTAKPFTDAEYPTGFGLVTDPKGNVYLSVRNPDHNVKVFSPDGKLTSEIGARGGRPTHGTFNEKAMRNPGQLAFDSKGRLWVPEETSNPKRTSVWNTDGSLAKEFIGTTGYAAAGSINPDQPTMAFSDNTVYTIDLAKGTWKPVYSLSGSGHADQLFKPSASSRARIFNRDGVTYVFSPTARNGAVTCTILKNGEWRVAAALGLVLPKNHPEGGPNFEHPLLKPHVGELYAWVDLNDDSLVQENELTFSKPKAGATPLQWASGYWGTLPGPDGTITQFTSKGTHVLQFPITSFTPGGAPVYTVAEPRIFAQNIRAGEGMIMGGSEGRAYFNANPLTALDAQGKIIFTYPNNNVSVHGSHTASAAKPGYLIGPSSILGTAVINKEVGEVFNLNGNLGENYLFTSDGLWIQSLFKDTRGWFDVPQQATRGMSLDAITAGGESFGGNFLRTSDGRVLLIVGGTDARVTEVTGLDTIKRFSGNVTYTPAQHEEAQKLLVAKAAGAAKKLVVTFKRAEKPPTIDGKPTEWPSLTDEAQPALLIGDDRAKLGRVAATYDDTNLYVAWRITSGSSTLRNAGQDSRMLFKTGDCVDVMIGPADGKPAEGNRRLLISLVDKKPVAVLYQPVAPGTAEKDRIPFSSPWRTINFDRVVTIPEVKIAISPTSGGFVVEASIPWSTLAVTPKAGLKLKGDFGILSADSGGTTTIARTYWSNKATNLVNDVPGEAELAPQLWGQLILE